MPEFTRDLDESLACFQTSKYNLIRHLERNYRENIHYTRSQLKVVNETKKQNGGQNRIVYMLTEEYKNIAMNILDLTAKCFVGLGLWAYFTKIIS